MADFIENLFSFFAIIGFLYVGWKILIFSISLIAASIAEFLSDRE